MKIWITRSCGGSIVSRGLGQVFVWFHEPCLDVTIANDDPFAQDNSVPDKVRKDLEGILFGRNCRYNFIYRKENDKSSGFGNKLVRNDDGIDFPQVLVDLYNDRKVRFQHEVFGDGPKVNYRKNTVQNLFGFDNPVSDKIWNFVLDEFQEGVPLTDTAFYNWSNLEKEKPWYLFCKEMEIEITLKE